MMKSTFALRPGDIIKERSGMPRCIVERRLSAVAGPDFCVSLEVLLVTSNGLKQGSIVNIHDEEIEVIELQELTPAQQHAEQLLRWARDYLALCQYDYEHARSSKDMTALEPRIKELSELLEKIDPPQPPTLLEALALVNEVAESGLVCDSDRARFGAVIDRARRAGLLP